MTLFSLLGFQRIEKQLNTAFNFIRDPEPFSEVERMWNLTNNPNDMVQRKEPLMSDSPLENEF